MNSKIKYRILASLILACLIVGGMAVWLLGTVDGAAWLLRTISKQAGAELKYSSIRGNLWNAIGMEGIEVQWQKGSAKCEKLFFLWHPLMVLTGNIAVDRLSLSNVLIQDDRPEDKKPLDLTWPKAKGLIARIDALIDKLEIKGMDYQRLKKTRIIITRASASVAWHRGKLSMDDMILDAPDVNIRGTVAAGFMRPSLEADLVFSPSSPLREIDRFLLKAALMPGRSTEQVNGQISINGMSGDVQRIDISGMIGVTKTSLNISDLHMTRRGRQGVLKGKGEMVFSDPVPQFQITVVAEHLDLSPEMKTSTDISGTLTGKGTLENYSGSLALSNEANKKHISGITVSFNGTQEGIHLQQIRAALLGGIITGQMQGSWGKGISLDSELQVRNINPAILAPEWTGSVNLNFSAKVTRTEKGDTEGELRGRILESRLRGRALTGEMQAGVRAQSFYVNKFLLKGKGFDLKAHGDLKKRLFFLANVTDLSGLIPDAAGQLFAEGWVSRNREQFSGSVSASGNEIAVGQMHMKKAEISAYFSEIEKSPVRLKAEIEGLAFKKLQFRSIKLQANGETSSHTMKISLLDSDSELLTELAGAYQKKMWHGKILRFSYKDTAGGMNLKSPAEVYVSDNTFSLSPLVMQGPRQEILSVKSEITMNPLSGYIQAGWDQLDIARVNQWLELIVIAGRASGNMHLSWTKGTLAEIRIRSMLSGSFSSRSKTQEVADARLQIEWRAQGLLASFSTEFSEGSQLTAMMTSSVPPYFGIPAQGEIRAGIKDFDLGLFAPFLPDHIELQGKGAANMLAKWANRDLLFLTGKADALGTVTSSGHQIIVKETSLNLETKGRKIISSLHLELANGGRVNGQFTFGIPPRLALPEQGILDAGWEDMNLVAFRSWFPEGLEVKGMLSGNMKGNLIPGGKFVLAGESVLSRGSVSRRTEKGQVSADIKTAAMEWAWNGDVFSGDINLSLSEHGKVAGQVALPIPAQVPLSVNREGPISIAIGADVREKGMLTSIFPGLVQDSHGAMQIKSQVHGTWKNPQFSGDFQLKDAGAYFFPTGIRLEDVAMQGHFERNIIAVDAFTAKSGDGSIEGSANIIMSDWDISRFEGTITGKEFRVLYLPELQAEINPQLKIEGSPEKLSIRGDIHVPELFVYGRETSATVEPSQDVVIVDAEERPDKKLPFALDVHMHVILGKKVFVKTEGIDARFEGDVYVSAKSQDNIEGKGLIYVAKGAYRRYGINLDVQRGRLVFGGLITRPNLDVLALRTVGDVKAGVKVTGTPQTPEVKLYSEPHMPDTDILSYIVLGHPMGEGKEQSSALLQASGALLSRGESVVLQEKLKQSIGVDVLDIQSGDGELSRSMLTIGKYLTPELFISYGQSLFGEGSVFRLRYSISKHWEVETQSGQAAGGDLYYKIDFK